MYDDQVAPSGDHTARDASGACLGVVVAVAVGVDGHGAVRGPRVDPAAGEVLAPHDVEARPHLPVAASSRRHDVAVVSVAHTRSRSPFAERELDTTDDLARRLVVGCPAGAVWAPAVEPVRTAAAVASATITPVMRDMDPP